MGEGRLMEIRFEVYVIFVVNGAINGRSVGVSGDSRK